MAMTNHTNHDHQATPSARAACRKQEREWLNAMNGKCGCGSDVTPGITGPEGNPNGLCGPTYCH